MNSLTAYDWFMLGCLATMLLMTPMHLRFLYEARRDWFARGMNRSIHLFESMMVPSDEASAGVNIMLLTIVQALRDEKQWALDSLSFRIGNAGERK